MPTYLYKCQDCGHRFEHAQGFHDDPLEVCPDCGGQVRRVIGNVGVTFKGSGFYRTDSRASGTKGKKPAEADKAPKTPAGGSKDSSSGSKDSSSGSKESSGGSKKTGGSSGSSGGSSTAP